MDRVIAFVPETGKIVVSAHVTFDEISKVVRKQPIVLQECTRKDKFDFYYLIGLIYRDDENGTLYTTNTIRVQNGYIVATRSPIVSGLKGPEEPKPVHARNVELMLADFLQTSCMQSWCSSTNQIVNVCKSLQGAPMEHTGHSQSNQLTEMRNDATISGSLEPTQCEPAVLEGTLSEAQSTMDYGERERPSNNVSLQAIESGTSFSNSTVSNLSTAPSVPASVTEFISDTASMRPKRHAPRQLTNVSHMGNITNQTQQLAVQKVPDMNSHMTRLMRMISETKLAGDEIEEELPPSPLPEVQDLTDTFWERRNEVDNRNDLYTNALLPQRAAGSQEEPPIQVAKLAYLSAKEMEEVDESDDSHPVWMDAKVEELRSQIIEHEAWEVTSLPPDRVPITARWVLKRKEVPKPKLKARFTIRGFQQREGEDYGETFAPVAKLITLRVFLSLVAIMQLFTYQLDLKTAFLNAPLEEEVYCKPTKDMPEVLRALLDTVDVTQPFKCKKTLYQSSTPWLTRIKHMIELLGEGGVLLLKRAVYGLKQAPRAWWLMFQAFLIALGFKSNDTDPCLYTMHAEDGNFVILLLYVDDVLIAASSKKLGEHIVSSITKKFRVSSEGAIENYLGIDIKIDHGQQKVYLSMSRYVEKMLKRFKMAPKPSVSTPLQEKYETTIMHSPLADEVFLRDFEYRPKVGCVLFLMICMRPALAFAIGLCARFSNAPTKAACAGVTQIIHYCYNTRNVALVLGGRNAYITGFCDSSLGGCKRTGRSTGGYCIFLGYGLVDWRSFLHNLVCQSIAEAEYVTLAELVKGILWLRWMLRQTNVSSIITKFSSTIFTDSMAAIRMAKNPASTQRTRHIALRYHLVRDLVNSGVFCLEHVITNENISDIFTKALGKIKYIKFAKMLLGYEAFQVPTQRIETVPSPTGEYV